MKPTPMEAKNDSTTVTISAASVIPRATAMVLRAFMGDTSGVRRS